MIILKGIEIEKENKDKSVYGIKKLSTWIKEWLIAFINE